MYVKTIHNQKEILNETLYECSSLVWNIPAPSKAGEDQLPLFLHMYNVGPIPELVIQIMGDLGETIEVYTMNDKGNTIDSRTFVF